jgi:hypothetical protein
MTAANIANNKALQPWLASQPVEATLPTASAEGAAIRQRHLLHLTAAHVDEVAVLACEGVLDHPLVARHLVVSGGAYYVELCWQVKVHCLGWQLGGAWPDGAQLTEVHVPVVGGAVSCGPA